MGPIRRLSLQGFLQALSANDLDQPLLIDFEPRQGSPEATFQEMKRHGLSGRSEQYLGSGNFSPEAVIVDGEVLYDALSARSVLEIERGIWLSWAGMTSAFHRDWNLWSVLNFLFEGEKVWYLIEASRILPRHENLVLGDVTSMVQDVAAGKYGAKVVQRANQCVYLPDGYYHHVETRRFSLSFSMWWTEIERLQQRRSIIDPWWLNVIRRDKRLKPTFSAAVASAYADRRYLDRAFSQFVYARYLRLCNRFNRNALRRYFADSRDAATRMKVLFDCESLKDAELLGPLDPQALGGKPP